VRRIWLTLVSLVVLIPVARADDDQRERFIRGAVQRARRSVSIGPTLGTFGALVTQGNEGEAGLSFGVGLYTYKIPVVPTPDELRAMIQSRVQAKVADRVKDMIAHGQPAPDQDELARMGREVFEEVKEEILSARSRPPRLVEKPRFVFDLEGVYLFRAKDGQLRTTLGIGVWKLSIGLTAVLHFGDGVAVYLGPELDLRLLPGKGPRSPVVDLFLRADFAASDRDTRGDLLTGGVRILLDLI
jgi:hypothetical protein